MAGETVRSDFDQMKNIQGRWHAEADATRNAINDLNSRMGQLKGGDWYGDAATKFYNEMESIVMPAMKRLNAALEEAARVTGNIAQTFKQAEDDCSGALNGSKLF